MLSKTVINCSRLPDPCSNSKSYQAAPVPFNISMPRASRPDSVLLLGIDFGTTFSCAAWYITDLAEASARIREGNFETAAIQVTPFGNAEQVKSALIWSRDVKCPKTVGRWKWQPGFGNDPRKVNSADCFELFKLGLDEEGYSSTITNQLKAQIKQLPSIAEVRSVDDLIAIYLEKLYKYSTDKINQSFVRSLGRKLTDTKTIRCILTIPVIWTYRMQSRMQRAASRAGLPNVRTVSEPEAGAIFVRYNEPERLSSCQSSFIGTNQPFLLIDCGGGTMVYHTYSTC